MVRRTTTTMSSRTGERAQHTYSGCATPYPVSLFHTTPLFTRRVNDPYPHILHLRNYTALIEAMHNEGAQGGKLFTAKAKTEPEFVAALQACRERPNHLCFLEVTIDKDDCSQELLEWGSRVAVANSRAPIREN